MSIGINKYPAHSGFPTIRYAEADAASLGPALGKWVDGPGWQVHLATLLGSDATLNEIRAAMQKIALQAGPDDLLFFNFDGMGVCQATHRSYDFAAFDSVMQADGTVQNGLRARDLGALLSQIPATEQYVILDTCGSHKALDDLRAALNPPGDERDLNTRQVHLIAPDGPSHETDKAGHGLLTAALLDGLHGGADFDHSGRITWDRVIGYVNWKLPETSAADGEGSDRLFPERLYTLTIYGDTAPPAAPPSRGLTAMSDESSPDNAGLGQDFALLIGTDHYSGGWPALHNPVFDVQAVHEEIVKDYGFRDDQSHIFEMHDPKKHDLDPVIAKLRAMHFGPRDRLLVYVAGHGHRTFTVDEQGKQHEIEGYLVFTNSRYPDTEDATDTMESYSDLTRSLRDIPVPHLLLVMDVCYGGLFNPETNVAFHNEVRTGGKEEGSPDDVIRGALTAKISRLYITSGDKDHSVGDGIPGQHSPFTKRFLDVLQTNRNAQPYLDALTIYEGVHSLKPNPTGGYFNGVVLEQNANYILIPRSSNASASSAMGDGPVTAGTSGNTP